MLPLNFKEFISPPTPSSNDGHGRLKPFRDWLMETKFHFGNKHKGKEIADIPIPYLKWVMDTPSAASLLSPQQKQEIAARLGMPTGQGGPAQPQQQPARPAATGKAANPNMVLVTGNTYPVKDKISALGGRYNAAERGWDVPIKNIDKIKAIPGLIVNAELDPQPITQKDEPKPVASKAEKSLIPSELMSEEQKTIDAKFEKLLNNPKQSHIMINALAGSGKTTMLKHLAWKYGKPEQKWLYIVFNTKNKVEAAEKFPPFVQVRTSNGFLGEVLKDRSNISKMPQTERMVKIDDKLEKARLLADSPEFVKLLDTLGIPANPNTRPYGEAIGKSITSLLRSIRYSFKEQVLTLIGLAKSFALDPRNQEGLDKGIEKILNSYDFDTDLVDIKERVAKRNDSYGANIRRGLTDILGYDFMQKDYKDEIVKASKWMLNATMPQGTNMQHQQGMMKHNLGEYRDFNDDLWYAATHADQINWPHFDVVLADEVQDFNEAQKIMLKKLHDAGAKIVAVGDPNQSIYRFRGADTGAFNNISNQLSELSDDKDVVHGLTTNFRSRKAIIDFANSETHVKNLKGKTFADGDHGKVSKYDIKYGDAFADLKQEQQQGKLKQTAFIARTNEPLVHSALHLLAQGIPFVIVGKDIATDLKKHIGKVIARFRLNDNDYVHNLADRLNEFRHGETEDHEGKSTKKVYLQEVNEVTDALLSAIQKFEEDEQNGNIANFKRWLTHRLGGLNVEENEKDLKEYQRKLKEENPVVLTTSHRSKGLEFSRVFILRYDQFPHKKAKRKEDIEQENNSKYVAITRAQDELHILDLEGQPGYKGKE